MGVLKSFFTVAIIAATYSTGVVGVSSPARERVTTKLRACWQKISEAEQMEHLTTFDAVTFSWMYECVRHGGNIK